MFAYKSLDGNAKRPTSLYTKSWLKSHRGAAAAGQLKLATKKKLAPFVDARDRIIQKRAKSIRDARDRLKLKVVDARDKLNAIVARKNRQLPVKRSPVGGRTAPYTVLTRTVKNRVQRKPKSPTKKKVAEKQVLMTPTGLTVIRQGLSKAAEDAAPPPQTSIFARTLSSLAADLQQRSSVVNVSATKSPLPGRSSGGNTGVSVANQFKVSVSNLHPNVTLEDIMELFGDVGPLRKVELRRPGLAEVIFDKMADAKKAVDNYHNRELDGQPMICRLVNVGGVAEAQRQTLFPSSIRVGTLHSDRMSSAAAAGSTPVKARITPDIALFHKVLFSRTTGSGVAATVTI